MSMSMPKPPILGLFCYGPVMTCSSEAVSRDFKDFYLISFSLARVRARVVSLAICCKSFDGLTECSGREVRRGAGLAAGGPRSHNYCAKNLLQIPCRCSKRL